jgi:hypothetical protein
MIRSRSRGSILDATDDIDLPGICMLDTPCGARFTACAPVEEGDSSFDHHVRQLAAFVPRIGAFITY